MSSSFSAQEQKTNPHRGGADDPTNDSPWRALLAALERRPAMVLGATLGVGAVLGMVIAKRDKGLLVDLAHLIVRLTLVAKKP